MKWQFRTVNKFLTSYFQQAFPSYWWRQCDAYSTILPVKLSLHPTHRGFSVICPRTRWYKCAQGLLYRKMIMDYGSWTHHSPMWNKINILIYIYNRNIITESTKALLRDIHGKIRNTVRTLVKTIKGRRSTSLSVIAHRLMQPHSVEEYCASCTDQIRRSGHLSVTCSGPS